MKSTRLHPLQELECQPHHQMRAVFGDTRQFNSVSRIPLLSLKIKIGGLSIFTTPILRRQICPSWANWLISHHWHDQGISLPQTIGGSLYFFLRTCAQDGLITPPGRINYRSQPNPMLRAGSNRH